MKYFESIALVIGLLATQAKTLPNLTTSADEPQVKLEKPYVSASDLTSLITLPRLLEHSAALQSFAYAKPGRNRLAGSPGHNATVNYIRSKLEELDGYYNVTLQPFPITIQVNGSADLMVNGFNQSAVVAEFSPSGNVSAMLSVADNLGCNATDYSPAVRGTIVLIKRGNCTFALKSARAGVAGALAAVIYNNVPTNISVTLGSDPIPEGVYVPTVGVSQFKGEALAAQIRNGSSLKGDLRVETEIQRATTYNVIADTITGDPSQTLTIGAHSDSVAAGPGINDDGSGIGATLEVAIQLSNYLTPNRIRFGFWSGEEEGKIGSTYYVSHLSNASKGEIKAYLNFDMLASPNFRLATFDGDASTFNHSAPKGSAAIEKIFKDYFSSEGLNLTETELTGSSDYAPFEAAGIPVGGLATGAGGNKSLAEVEMFGGVAGQEYDPNYHSDRDTLGNLNETAYLVNARAVAFAVASLGTSLAAVEEMRFGNDRSNATLAVHLGAGVGVRPRAVRRKVGGGGYLSK